MELYSTTPREAALKAATRDIRVIWLVDPQTGKMHIFEGYRRPLMDHEHTDFTRRRNIAAKPIVTKMAYKNLNSPLTRGDVPRIVAEFNTLTHG